jgi:hypothetical protein
MHTKRVYTQELHDAKRGSLAKSPKRVLLSIEAVSLCLTRHNSAAMLGDELVNALQNVGSRVRKSTLIFYILR